jgi:hypothetical protein
LQEGEEEYILKKRNKNIKKGWKNRKRKQTNK